MSDRRSGWLVVIIAAVLGVIVSFLAYSGVFQKALTAAYESSAPPVPGSWVDGAIAGLAVAAPGLIMVIVVAAVGFVIGKDLWIRVVAVAVAVCTAAGVAIAGGAGMTAAGAEAVEYWESYPSQTGSFDCTQPGMQTPPGMQEALDELVHPGHVDTLMTSVEACGGVIPSIPIGEAIPDYQSQLETAGWAVVSVDETQLTAERAELTFVVSSCGEATSVEIRLTTASVSPWC